MPRYGGHHGGRGRGDGRMGRGRVPDLASEQQIEDAAEIVRGARKALYRLLAEQ